MYQTSILIFTAEPAQWLRLSACTASRRKVQGSIPGADKGILDFWGANRPAFLENIFKAKTFFLKNSFFSSKINLLDINRY